LWDQIWGGIGFSGRGGFGPPKHPPPPHLGTPLPSSTQEFQLSCETLACFDKVDRFISL